MIKQIYFWLICLSFNLINAQYTIIPDSLFEQKLIDLNIDTEAVLDGRVLTTDINLIESLDVSDTSIYDMTGIEDFISLKHLNCSSVYGLSSLNVSLNSNLETLNICCNDNFTTLNINDCTKLKFLDVGETSLVNFTFANTTNLETLILGNDLEPASTLPNLDLSNNINLKTLICNYIAPNLDVSSLINLEYLDCHGNFLTSLDISNLTQLTQLHCQLNDLSFLDLQNNTLLTTVNCGAVDPNNLGANHFTNLDFSNNPNLVYLNCSGGFVNFVNTTLNIANGNNENLTHLNVSTQNFLLTCIEVDNQYIADQANNSDINGWIHGDNYTANCDFLEVTEETIFEVIVYPNPVTNYFIVQVPNKIIKQVTLFDYLGKKAATFVTNKVTITNLNNGIYFALIETKDGMKFTKKIIKK